MLAVRARHGRRVVIAAILLGVGLGGLWDGIVLHQILQWHHLVSEPVPPTTVEGLQANTLADGLFHALAWVVVVAGVFVLASAGEARSEEGAGGRLVGGALLGWGGFNLVEGVVDHHLLGLHHVRPGPDALAWDLAFLAWGAVMAVIGLVALARAGRRTG